METFICKIMAGVPANQECFEATDFNPTYPAHDTQPARLLAMALVGQWIDPLTAWRTLGIYRIADATYRLRSLGWPIQTGCFDVNNRFKEACRVARYGLLPKHCQSAGAEGQFFAEHEINLMAQRRAA